MAVKIGISPRDYDDMTPHELTIHVEEYQSREKYMQRERIAAAYLGAYFERVKRMPDIDKFLKDEPQQVKTKEKAAADMFAEVSRLNAMFGGTVDEHFKGD